MVGVATENRSASSFTLGSRSPASSPSSLMSASTLSARCAESDVGALDQAVAPSFTASVSRK